MDTGIIISILSVGVAILVAFWNYSRSTNKDRDESAIEKTTIIVKLENISDGIKDIKNDMKELKSEVEGLKERVVLVEASTKSAHKRLDTLEKNDK